LRHALCPAQCVSSQRVQWKQAQRDVLSSTDVVNGLQRSVLRRQSIKPHAFSVAFFLVLISSSRTVIRFIDAPQLIKRIEEGICCTISPTGSGSSSFLLISSPNSSLHSFFHLRSANQSNLIHHRCQSRCKLLGSGQFHFSRITSSPSTRE
jgi:hypothetical protein